MLEIYQVRFVGEVGGRARKVLRDEVGEIEGAKYSEWVVYTSEARRDCAVCAVTESLHTITFDLLRPHLKFSLSDADWEIMKGGLESSALSLEDKLNVVLESFLRMDTLIESLFAMDGMDVWLGHGNAKVHEIEVGGTTYYAYRQNGCDKDL